jgi:hypothetical protein
MESNTGAISGSALENNREACQKWGKGSLCVDRYIDSHFCFVPYFLWINISNFSDLFSKSMRSEEFSGTKGNKIVSIVNRP